MKTAGNIQCPSCGAAATLDAGKCKYCQALLKTVACPACFETMFQGSKFCPHCGQRAGKIANKARSVRHCPRCQQALHEVQVAGTPLDQCHTCGGFWIAVEAFDQVCNNREAQTAATGLRLPPPIAPEPEVRYVGCPECGKLMNRTNYAGGSGVIVDLCREHGIWLDRDELRHVVEFIQAGGVDRVRKRDIEKLQLERSAIERERAMSRGNLSGVPDTASDNVDSAYVLLEFLSDLIHWIRK